MRADSSASEITVVNHMVMLLIANTWLVVVSWTRSLDACVSPWGCTPSTPWYCMSYDNADLTLASMESLRFSLPRTKLIYPFK